MKNNIIITIEEETNANYDARLARNGGGYSQPLIEGFYFNKPFKFLDSSCGDFGKRIDFELGSYCYQLDEIGNSFREDSNFPESYKNILKIFSEEFGYKFLTEKDLK